MDEPEKQRLENQATRVASLELKIEKSKGRRPPISQVLRVAIGNLLQAQTDLQALGALLDQILAAEVQTDPVARKAQIRSVVTSASAFARKQQQQIGEC